jgi:hypothetical protein
VDNAEQISESYAQPAGRQSCRPLEANCLRRATGSHDPYIKSRSDSESTPSMAFTNLWRTE